MDFFICPKIDGKPTRLKVELVHKTEVLEHYEVTAKNKSLTLQTNRLLFQEKGLKHRKGQWKLIAGHLHNTAALDKIIKAIEEKLLV
jgi:hypothetical protein